MSDKPNFSGMDDRKLSNWLSARCEKCWVLTRTEGLVTVVCDFKVNDTMRRFETTMVGRIPALVNACERVFAMRQGGYMKTGILSVEDMAAIITDRWYEKRED